MTTITVKMPAMPVNYTPSAHPVEDLDEGHLAAFLLMGFAHFTDDAVVSGYAFGGYAKRGTYGQAQTRRGASISIQRMAKDWRWRIEGIGEWRTVQPWNFAALVRRIPPNWQAAIAEAQQQRDEQTKARLELLAPIKDMLNQVAGIEIPYDEAHPHIEFGEGSGIGLRLYNESMSIVLPYSFDKDKLAIIISYIVPPPKP